MIQLITGDIIRDILNIMFFLLLVTIFVGVFIDSRNQGVKVLSALGWAFIGSLAFPPFGLIFYVFYRRKRWL